MDEGRAEARLAVELVTVQLNERAGKLDRQIRAERGIGHGDDEQQRADRPQHPGKGKDREGAIDRHEREGKRGGGERAHILGDPLIRICEFARRRQAMVGSVRHVNGDSALGHEFAPKQAKPLLGKARQNGYDRGPREDRKRELGLLDELRGLPFRDGGHQVSVDETVCDIEAVRAKEQRKDRGEHQFRFPADLRPGEGSDRPRQAASRQHSWAFPGLACLASANGRWIDDQSTRSQEEGEPRDGIRACSRPASRASIPTPIACPLPAAASIRPWAGTNRRRAKGTLRRTCPRCRARRTADAGTHARAARARRRPRRRASRRPSNAPASRSGSGARCRARPFRRHGRSSARPRIRAESAAIVSAST